MSKADPAPGGTVPPHLSFDAMLRKLAQRSSVLVAPAETEQRTRPCVALVREGETRGSVVLADFERARRLGLVEQQPGGKGWRLSGKGRMAVRRMTCAAGDGEDAANVRSQPGHNPDESPLAWLRRRRGKDGAALISEAQFLAGERLRADFTFAQLQPRVTLNWDLAATAGGGARRMPGGSADMADHVLAAGERVNRALKAVGPELAGVLVDVCCFLKGLEDTERSVGWPQRSGKVVLQLALSALARHYGIAGDEAHVRAAARPRHWGAPGYRPAIDGEEDQPDAD